MYNPPSVFAMEEAGFVPVHLTISNQATHFPHRPAVICDDEQISFRELEKLSTDLAALLQSKGLGVGSRIALLFEPGIQLIVSLLAIHKVGAAFIPLSSSYPQARILSMLESSSCKFILGDEKNREILVGSDVEYLSFTDEELSCTHQPFTSLFQHDPEATAYIHFTSGSTGTPKGVNILHRNLSYYVDWSVGFFRDTVKNRLPMTSSMQFAASISQIYSSLATGETLHILRDCLNDPEKLFAWYAKHPGFGFYCVPTVWKSALDWREKKSPAAPGPATLFLSGEDISEGLQEETFFRFPDMDVWNLYGPTEAVANLSCKKVSALEGCSMGTPIPETSFYVVKEDGTEAKINDEGILYAAGPGICAGYIANKQLTDAVFFPYVSERDGTVQVYNTGDIVRLTDTLEFQFIGRKDQQVKIHGQRIELGEIENRLSGHPQIVNAVVSWITGDQPFLAAYIETKSEAVIPVNDLRVYLLQFVTDIMLPERWVFLHDFPKLENGKIDRKSLPVPEDNRPLLGTEFSPAKGEREEKIVSAFKTILKIEGIGLDDSFFDLGGNSLKALALLIEIEELFHYRIPFKTLFAHPDARALLEQIPKILPEKDLYTRKISPETQILPLSTSQNGLLFFQEAYPENASYNIAYSVNLEGELDVTRLKKALTEVVQRHLPLHFRLKKGADGATFIPEEHTSIELTVELLTCVPEAQRERFVDDSISTFAALPFTLYDAPLYRCKLYRLGGEKNVLAWVVNHLVFDGESMAVFLADLHQIYQGQKPAPLAVTFADVVQKRTDYQRSLVFEQDYSFWKGYLKGVSELHSFPLLYQPQKQASFRGRRVTAGIDQQLREKLLHVCRAQGVTLNTVLMAAFVATLHKFGQREEYVVASPFSNRLQKSDSSLIGYFSNTLLYRVPCPTGCRFSDLLESIGKDTVQILDHQHLPFDQLVKILRQQGVNLPVSLFRTLFALHDTAHWSKKDEGLSIKARELFNNHAKCDLHLECFDDQHKIGVELTYAQDVIDESAALQVITVFTQVLQEIPAQYNDELASLGALTGNEKEEVLRCSVAEKKDYGSLLTLSGLFRKSCSDFPELPAISFAKEVISYGDLAQKVDICIAHLSTIGLENREPVGIFLDNTPELIIAILAAASLGHPYVPLDPTYPKERIRYINEHAEIRYVLTSADLEIDVFPSTSKLIFVDEVLSSTLCKSEIKNEPTPEDLLYIIYTSGSTGNPKGVMLPNRGVANYLLWMKDCFNTGTDTKILAKTSISFDISVWELFLPLISGGTLCLEKRADIESPEQTASVIRARNVNIFQFVPSALKLFSDDGMFAQTPSLKKIFCGGEKMPLSLKDDVLSQFKGELYNLYGPTEASIFMNCYRCTTDSPLDKVSIGNPIPNSSLYVLDKDMRLLPRNMPGDLYIGGDVLATGYLGDQEKTDKAFKRSPETLPEKMLYATGDRGRMLSCGKFELLGRDDHQVKIRGYRVELQEIDKAIEKISGVKQAATYMNQHSEYDARLHVVVVPDTGANLAEEAIRAELKTTLPAYMIPASISLVQSIPLLPNGKINQKELGKQQEIIVPAISEQNSDSKSDTIEKRIIEIWSEVLGQENFTTSDNFFDVGGHSLLFQKIKDLIQRRLDTNFSIVELYQYPNIASMVEQYRNKMGNDGPSAAVSAVRNRIAKRIRKYHGKK